MGGGVCSHLWPPETAPYGLDRFVLPKVSSHFEIGLGLEGSLCPPRVCDGDPVLFRCGRCFVSNVRCFGSNVRCFGSGHLQPFFVLAIIRERFFYELVIPLYRGIGRSLAPGAVNRLPSLLRVSNVFRGRSGR